MKSGRPPKWLIDPDIGGPVVFDACAIDATGRTSIPARLLNEVSWYTPAHFEKGVECHLQISSNGRVQIGLWEETEDSLREERLQRMEVSTTELESFVRFELSNYRAVFEPKGRLHMPKPLLHYLQRDWKLLTHCYVLVVQQRLEILSPSFATGELSAGNLGWSGEL